MKFLMKTIKNYMCVYTIQNIKILYKIKTNSVYIDEKETYN